MGPYAADTDTDIDTDIDIDTDEESLFRDCRYAIRPALDLPHCRLIFSSGCVLSWVLDRL